MMRVIVMTGIALLNFVLQATAFRDLAIIGVKPNTAVLLIAAYAILRGDVEGAVFGFFAGLLQDVFFGRVFGLYTFLGMAAGFFCGKPFRDFYRENYWIPILVVGLACVLYELAFFLCYFLFQGATDILYFLWRLILPEAVYTVIVAIPLYRALYAINGALEHHERYTRKLFR